MTNQNQRMTAAVAAFEQWRNARVHPTEKTPNALQKQAVALLPYFSTHEIISTLNISGTNLKRWSGHPKEVAQFVTLPHVDQPQTQSTGLNLELAFNNGCHLRLQGDISAELLMALTQTVTAQVRSV